MQNCNEGFIEIRDGVDKSYYGWAARRRGIAIASIAGAIIRAGSADGVSGIVKLSPSREMRLALASDVFDKHVTSFSKLLDGEIDALAKWVVQPKSREILRAWVVKRYRI